MSMPSMQQYPLILYFEVELVRLDPHSSTGVGGGVTAAGGVVSAAEMVMRAVVAAARAIWVVSSAAEGRAVLLQLGLLQTLPVLLQYNSAALQQAVIGTLHQCLIEVLHKTVIMSDYLKYYS